MVSLFAKVDNNQIALMIFFSLLSE